MLQMENTPPSPTLSRFLQSSYLAPYFDIKLVKFLSNFHIFLQLLFNYFVSTKWKLWTNKDKNLNNITEPLKQQFINCLHDKGSDINGKVSRGDIEMVMERLGIVFEAAAADDDDERFFGEDEVSVLLEAASLEEVKEAFDVFDENRDGFISAVELQRVLLCLGLEKEVDQCTRMIRAFDDNGDGLIDFDEFVNLMQKCPC